MSALVFEDFIEKKTQLALELYGELKATHERTNSLRLYSTMSDLLQAVEEADLTEIQRECIRLYYFEGYSLQEIGEMMGGRTRSTISRNVKAAVIKIADVFRKWEYWEEGESNKIV